MSEAEKVVVNGCETCLEIEKYRSSLCIHIRFKPICFKMPKNAVGVSAKITQENGEVVFEPDYRDQRLDNCTLMRWTAGAWLIDYDGGSVVHLRGIYPPPDFEGFDKDDPALNTKRSGGA